MQAEAPPVNLEENSIRISSRVSGGSICSTRNMTPERLISMVTPLLQ